MTATFTEGNLQIVFANGLRARKFDDTQHGLSHCMKAVDFIVEHPDRYVFIEFKDPQNPASLPKDQSKFIQEFRSGDIDKALRDKYRDSFLYEWASERVNKPIYYYVLIAIDTLTEADLLPRTDNLRQQLPVESPSSGAWKRPIVAGCAIFNISAWNKTFPDYAVSRTTP